MSFISCMTSHDPWTLTHNLKPIIATRNPDWYYQIPVSLPLNWPDPFGKGFVGSGWTVLSFPINSEPFCYCFSYILEVSSLYVLNSLTSYLRIFLFSLSLWFSRFLLKARSRPLEDLQAQDMSPYKMRTILAVTRMSFRLWVKVHGLCDVMHDVKDILGHGLWTLGHEVESRSYFFS